MTGPATGYRTENEVKENGEKTCSFLCQKCQFFAKKHTFLKFCSSLLNLLGILTKFVITRQNFQNLVKDSYFEFRICFSQRNSKIDLKSCFFLPSLFKFRQSVPACYLLHHHQLPLKDRLGENKFRCQIKRGCKIFTTLMMLRLHIFDGWPSSSSSSWKVKVLDKAKVMVQLFFPLGWVVFFFFVASGAERPSSTAPYQRWLG